MVSLTKTYQNLFPRTNCGEMYYGNNKLYLNIKLVAISIFMFFASFSYGQTHKICGTVSNEKTGGPIADVTICMQKGNPCTKTDNSGKFCLEVFDTTQIRFADINGMRTININKINNSEYSITLLSFADIDLYDFTLKELKNIKIISASKKEENASEAAASVEIITAKDITEKGYLSLLEILRDVPMVDVSSPGQGYSTDIGGRGINPNASMGKYWLILVDGHEMGWSQFTRNLISDAWISVDNIERVEIIKGPSSALWGANAYLGVINIIVKDATNNLSGFIKAAVGSNSTYSANVTLSGKIGSKGSFYSALSGLHENIPIKVKEWSDEKGEDVILENNECLYLNSYTKFKYGNFYINAMLSKDNSHHSNSSFAVGAEDALFQINKYFVDGGWKKEFKDKATLDLSIFYDYTEWGPDAHYEDNPYNGVLVTDDGSLGGTVHFIRDMAANDKMLGAKVVSHINFSPKLSIIVGGEFENNNAVRWYYPKVWEYENLEVPKFSIYELGLYGQLNYKPIQSLNISGGLRYDYHEIYKQVVSPRASIVYNPEFPIILKLMYGKAYKAPSLHELYYFRRDAVYGNPNLKPEYNNTFETQLIYKLSDFFEASMSLFYIDMKNIIAHHTVEATETLEGLDQFPPSQQPTGATFVRQQHNAGHHVSKGIEAKIDYQPLSNLMLTLSGTYRKPTDEDNGGEEIPQTSKYKLYSVLSYTLFSKYTLSLTGKYIGSAKVLEWVAKEPGYEFIPEKDPTLEAPEYFVLNASITAHNIFEHFDLNFKVNNVTNKEYYEPSRNNLYHQPGISFFGKLIYHF